LDNPLLESIAWIFADIHSYNRLITTLPSGAHDGRQRTRYLQRMMFAMGYSAQTVKEVMERGDEIANTNGDESESAPISD